MALFSMSGNVILKFNRRQVYILGNLSFINFVQANERIIHNIYSNSNQLTNDDNIIKRVLVGNFPDTYKHMVQKSCNSSYN